MTFVRTAFFPGGTGEHYRALAAELRSAPQEPEGRLWFVAGPTVGGWQVVQAWTEEAALAAYNRAWLLPALARVGAAGFPEAPQVRDFVAHEEWRRPDPGPVDPA